MTTEAPKAASPPQEQAAPQPPIVYPPNALFPPPPPGFPTYFFAPPAEGTHPENGANGSAPAPLMMLPPGMIYAFPPQAGQSVFPAPASNVATSPPPSNRPKRQQVKMACTNCASACKRCDSQRPCERCLKYGLQESCVDGIRKERKKGVKRGPYKRKTKIPADAAFSANEGSQEWSGTPPASTAPPQAAIHAVAQLAGAPEGGMLQTIPLIYPGYMPPLQPDGQPAPDGTVPNGHPPVMPYYITGFPPAFPYPYGLMPLPQSAAQQPQAAEAGAPKADEAGTSAAATSTVEAGPVNPDENGGATASKKRSKSGKETKSKRPSKRKKGTDSNEDNEPS